MTRWYIKRKPMRESFFRDGFPYFGSFELGGAASSWVQTRDQAQPFRHLDGARAALVRLKNQTHHREHRFMVVVRVTNEGEGDGKGAT